MKLRFSGPSLLILIFIGVLISSCNPNAENKSLPRSTPESETVSNQDILNFIEAVENSDNEIHSLMILRNGKVISEGWWAPYNSSLRHTMYSTSKSFTSTAIGFAVMEGIITVNDKVISFFPDELPDTISENLADLEIRDLLSMSVGQDPKPVLSMIDTENWVKSFLATEIKYKPGTQFLYNSAASYMLSAIIQIVMGEKLIDYLKPRLLDPLGIEGMDWEVDPNGINTGGWGFRIKTEDMAKFGQLYLQNGKWKGKQIISEEWVKEATSFKIDQAPELLQEEKNKSDWNQGYCYQFWRSRHNSYRADGAYGQYILILPEKDAVIAITSETHDMGDELNLVWEHLLPAFKEENIKTDSENSKKLNEKLASLQLRIPEGNTSVMENEITGNTYEFKSGNKKASFTFQFNDDECSLNMGSDAVEYNLSFGSGYWLLGETNKSIDILLSQKNNVLNDLSPHKVAGAYTWKSDSLLELTLRYIESPHTEVFQFTFNPNGLRMSQNNSRTPGLEPEIIIARLIQ